MPTPRRTPNITPVPAVNAPRGAVPVAFDAVDDSSDPGHDATGPESEGMYMGANSAPGGGYDGDTGDMGGMGDGGNAESYIPASQRTIDYAPTGTVSDTPPPAGPAFSDVDDAFNSDTWREWLVPAQDAKGHSERIGIRVQPALTRQLELVLQCKSWPYKTASDVIRHAIMRHLGWLARHRPDMPSVMAQVEAIAEVVRDETLLSDQEHILSQLAATAEYAASKQDVTTVRRVMQRALESINGMPPGAWRDSYRTKFQTQFAGYLIGTGLAPGNTTTPQGQIGGNAE